MLYKRLLVAVGISIVAMLLILNFMYNFQFTGINMANVLFIVGAFYFFPGLVGVTGAGSVFSGIDYAAKRRFMSKKKAERYFKTYGEFMEHKNAKNLTRGKEGKGNAIFIVGVVYILASIVLGMVI